MEPTRYHFGVYARIRCGERMLLVRKTRGPYAGLLDLPGGRPDPGESWAQTLERELHEELGVRVAVTGNFTALNFYLEHADFHHPGGFTDLPTARPPAGRSPHTARFD